jgi:hypothetical protein
MNQTVLKQVKKLLEEYPLLREQKASRKLIWAYWVSFCGVNREVLTKEKWYSGQLPQPETITRACRKVKEDYPHLRGSKESQWQRKEQQREYKEQLGYSPMTEQDYREQAQFFNL